MPSFFLLVKVDIVGFSTGSKVKIPTHLFACGALNSKVTVQENDSKYALQIDQGASANPAGLTLFGTKSSTMERRLMTSLITPDKGPQLTVIINDEIMELSPTSLPKKKKKAV
ncbi:hypothetical protein MJO28_014521 [Puccinia striiformis f. sp. tritici]|uniref:Uncharacterized protein n=1 Tax=Puccinia striiformis f. sp. tritici TaxID=168172 RepID=A0ACC0DU62_9BASI|nr:hypothetical protein MJO28_014521 [Puccinia striiformis f. sp. tritici]